MRRVLHISASPAGATSHSRRAGQRLVSGLQRMHGSQVIRRDLAAEPLPYPSDSFVRASLMLPFYRGSAETEALSMSERLIGELESADTVVIDSPMHNLTVPACLKSWIDHVVRPHRTFRHTPEGKIGLLDDKPVYILVSCGGGFDAALGGQTDFMTSYLRNVLGTMGLKKVDIFRLDNMLRGEAAAADGHLRAETWIDERLTRGTH